MSSTSGETSLETPKHVVIVMDTLKEFSMEPIEWVLKNIALKFCCTVTLLGVMPWLSIPMASKTWLDSIWHVDLQEFSNRKDQKECERDVKYQSVQRLLDLCQKYEVVPQIITQMGYPLRLLVVEQIATLHPTFVVFDRHHNRKNIDYYKKKVACNIAMMKSDGGVDMIK